VADGQNPNDLGVNKIGDVVSKDLEIDSAIFPGTNVVQLGLACDPSHNGLDFLFETNPQTGFNRLGFFDPLRCLSFLL